MNIRLPLRAQYGNTLFAGFPASLPVSLSTPTPFVKSANSLKKCNFVSDRPRAQQRRGLQSIHFFAKNVSPIHFWPAERPSHLGKSPCVAPQTAAQALRREGAR